MLLGVNLHYLVATKNYALAFYALFLLIVGGIYCLHLYRNLSEAYYHAGQRWFEGQPVFLPRIEADLSVGDKTYPGALEPPWARGLLRLRECRVRAGLG